jgi:hypothetical protein
MHVYSELYTCLAFRSLLNITLSAGHYNRFDFMAIVKFSKLRDAFRPGVHISEHIIGCAFLFVYHISISSNRRTMGK